MASNSITVRLTRSAIGRPEKQRVVLRGMGLTKLRKMVELPDTPETRGMIEKVKHLVKIESPTTG